MDRKRSNESGHGAGAVITDWTVLVVVGALLTMWFMSWTLDIVAQAAHDTGKQIESSLPADR